MKKLVLLLVFISSLSISNAQNFEWAQNIGNSNLEKGYSITADTSGNVYITGIFKGTVDFNFGTGVNNLASAGSVDIYILKLDSLGNFIWAKSIGGDTTESVSSIHFDSMGNLLLCGYFRDTVDFNPGLGVFNMIGMGGIDGFILKLDSNGNFIWAKQLVGKCYPNDITSDSFGNVFSTGALTDTIDFDPGIGTYILTPIPGSSNYDAFVLKLDSSGNFVWVKKFGGPDRDEGHSIAVDLSGNVYTVGGFHASCDFDPDLGTFYLSAVGTNTDIYITKLSSSGTLIWAKMNGGFDIDSPTSIKIGPDMNIYYCGSFQGTVDFDPNSSIVNNINAGGADDFFISKIDSLGTLIWVKTSNGVSGEKANSLFVDFLNNVYVTGLFQGTMDFDPGLPIVNLSSTGSLDVYVLKLTGSGNYIWAGRMGGTSYDEGLDIAVSTSGDIYTTGWFQTTADFNPGAPVANLTALGSGDMFIQRLSQDVCSNIASVVDSVYHVNCLSQGYAIGHGENGLMPYTYQWSTTPTFDSAFVNLSGSGIYTLTVTDANSCIKSSSIFVDGAGSFSAFDLNANLVASNLRGGFPASIWLDGFNDGCIPQSGQLTLVLDTLASFVSATPPPSLILGDTLIWNFLPITYDSAHITPQIFVNISPTASIGQLLCFDVAITPISGDADTLNNIKNYCIPIIGPYDPNIKSVYPEGYCAPHYIENNKLLTYTVQFQNTGTASAINVFVLDTLDSDLDLNSLRVIGNSHPLITEVLPSNVLKFRFDNIMLPDSTSDEPGSHGYVIFEVEPLPSLANGTEIKNDVGIYFDFNAPIYTNTVLNTISDGIINANTTLIGTTITSSFVGGTYQWIDCITDDSLIGETNQTFNITANGSYAVIVSDGCLTDTSACVNFNTIGINELNNSSNFSIYPNPSQNNISVITTKPTELFISNLLGEIVLQSHVIDKSVIDISHLNNGVYFIRNSEGNTVKFIKQ